MRARAWRRDSALVRRPSRASRAIHAGVARPRPRSATTRSSAAETSDRVTSTTGRASDGRTNASSSAGTKSHVVDDPALLHRRQHVERQPREERGVVRPGQRRRRQQRQGLEPDRALALVGLEHQAGRPLHAGPPLRLGVGHRALPHGLDPDDQGADRRERRHQRAHGRDDHEPRLVGRGHVQHGGDHGDGTPRVGGVVDDAGERIGTDRPRESAASSRGVHESGERVDSGGTPHRTEGGTDGRHRDEGRPLAAHHGARVVGVHDVPRRVRRPARPRLPGRDRRR